LERKWHLLIYSPFLRQKFPVVANAKPPTFHIGVAKRLCSRILALDSSQRIVMSSRKKARLAFASALVLLLLSGIAASVTILRLWQAAQWVTHSYDVQLALADAQSALAKAARLRTVYINSGDTGILPQYESAKNETIDLTRRVRELTTDNPTQQDLYGGLRELTDRRVALLDESVALRKSGPLDESTQTGFSRENIDSASDLTNVIQQMDQEEERLLGQRRKASGSLFTIVLCILVAMFAVAILLLWIHFRLLANELAERERMEQNARLLSGRLLQVQDEERRKFSRELHDSLGQILALAKMHLSVLLGKNPHDELLAEVDKLLDESVTETRTISYLLHPPLLDEVGLASAAKWYAEGFAKRSGIQLSVDIANDVGRLSRPAELALFRVLQESLTNIHRHAKSPKAEVSLRALPAGIVLGVRDFGAGIPAGTLQRFLSTGANVGVGLAGIRERIREQGGKFELQSDKHGTVVTVTMPTSVIAKDPESDRLTAAASAD
jgi:signal transduction histidine kinase